MFVIDGQLCHGINIGGKHVMIQNIIIPKIKNIYIKRLAKHKKNKTPQTIKWHVNLNNKIKQTK